MDLVDDEDLVAIADGNDAEPAHDDVADLVHLRVGRGVDLEDVDVAPFGDLAARVAAAARIRGRPRLAVQRAREDARGGRFADAARAGKHERLGEAFGRDRVTQRLGDAALADHVGEALGTPFARENLVGHGQMSNAEC